MNVLTRWVFIFLLFVFMVAWNFAIGGCAQVPECEKFNYGIMTHKGEQYVLLDQDNTAKLSSMVEGLSKGTCRLPE